MNYRDDKIRAAKAAKRLTNPELAEKAGVGVGTVVRACNGKSVAGASLEAIAGALGIPMADLYEPKAEEAGAA
jgi:transcriptional regulator with XRE-family HTH domain